MEFSATLGGSDLNTFGPDEQFQFSAPPVPDDTTGISPDFFIAPVDLGILYLQTCREEFAASGKTAERGKNNGAKG